MASKHVDFNSKAGNDVLKSLNLPVPFEQMQDVSLHFPLDGMAYADVRLLLTEDQCQTVVERRFAFVEVDEDTKPEDEA